MSVESHALYPNSFTFMFVLQHIGSFRHFLLLHTNLTGHDSERALIIFCWVDWRGSLDLVPLNHFLQIASNVYQPQIWFGPFMAGLFVASSLRVWKSIISNYGFQKLSMFETKENSTLYCEKKSEKPLFYEIKFTSDTLRIFREK